MHSNAFLTFTPPANNQAFLDGLYDNPDHRGPALGRKLAGVRLDRRDGDRRRSSAAIRDIEDFPANICAETAAAFD